MSQKDSILLKSLNIQNLATFEQENIDFQKGLNIIIGETGSGKSLILDALQLIFGNRADKTLVRTGEEFAVIEARFEFSAKSISDYLQELGYPSTNNEILIKRIIYATGKTRSFINFQQCNLTTLNDLTRKYVDLVGQFENQKLLSQNYLLQLLDNFSDNSVLLSKYQSKYKKLKEVDNEITELENKLDNGSQALDFIKFQINEIEDADLKNHNETDLIKKKEDFLSFQERQETYNKALGLLDNNENSIIQSLNQLKKITQFKHFSDMDISKIEEHILFYEDISYELNQKSNEEFDQNEFNNVINKLDQAQKLKRKYGQSIEDILKTLKELHLEKEKLDNLESNIDALKVKKENILNQINKDATDLNVKRNEGAKKLSKLLSKNIQSLNMKGASIIFEIKKSDQFKENGSDNLKVIAETNPGEGYFELKKIASGGELSRVLLSIRQALTSKESVSIFLFDEVDSGIGGETALVIGKSLKKVSEVSQVIAISHLPQIATHSDVIIKVDKKTQKTKDRSRTYSKVTLIDKPKLIKEEAKSMTPLQ